MSTLLRTTKDFAALTGGGGGLSATVAYTDAVDASKATSAVFEFRYVKTGVDLTIGFVDDASDSTNATIAALKFPILSVLQSSGAQATTHSIAATTTGAIAISLGGLVKNLRVAMTLSGAGVAGDVLNGRLVLVEDNQMIPGGPLGAGSSVPSPGGDVSGAIGSLTVAKIDGRALALNGQGGAPALDDGDLLAWNAGGGAWIPSGIGEPFQFYTFAGRNGAGAITVTGATIGWVTKMCLTISGGALEGQTNNFEAAISVTDQIQQTSGLDLSALTYFLILQKS